MVLKETDSSPEQVAQLVQSVLQEDLLYALATTIHLLPFETRKDTQTVFSYVLRYKPEGSTNEPPAVAYVIDNRPDFIVELCKGYQRRESALPCGFVLREALKHEAIAAIILYDESDRDGKAIMVNDIDYNDKQTGDGVFWKFIDWIDKGDRAALEVSTDAFTTFRV